MTSEEAVARIKGATAELKRLRLENESLKAQVRDNAFRDTVSRPVTDIVWTVLKLLVYHRKRLGSAIMGWYASRVA